jgi:hypothetical protein
VSEIYLPCPSCCKNIYMSKEEWMQGGVYQCKKCGWKIRIPKHGEPKQPSPRKDVPVTKKKK